MTQLHHQTYKHLRSKIALRRPTLFGVSVILISGFVAGCANQPPASGLTAAGLNCIDDSPTCIDRRQTALRTMMADRRRTWVQRPPSAEAYASGVRLFAFKKSKKSLTCDELGLGIREASGARASLRRAADRLSPAQIARSAMLGDEVSRELSREKKRRCKKG